jgi:hypothetical protein
MGYTYLDMGLLVSWALGRPTRRTYSATALPVWWTAALALPLHAYVELVNRRRQRSRLTWLFRSVPQKPSIFFFLKGLCFQ